MKTQPEILLDYLMTHDSISGLECINILNILNYKGRIHDLRKAGYTINTKMIKTSSDKTYARYSLVTKMP